MAFRDENEALRQRVQRLEEELAETQEELEELRNPPKARVEIDEAEPSGGGLAQKVAAKERAEQAAELRRQQKARELRRREHQRLIDHGSRLKVTRAGSETIIEVGPGPLRDQLIDQAGFGVFFAAINPGIFVVGGLAFLLTLVVEKLSFGAAIGLAVPIWLVILAVLNLVYAHFARSRFRVAFDDENFEVKKTGNDATSFLGRRKDLDVRVDEKGPGEVRLRHASQRATIECLIQEDLDAFRTLIGDSAGEMREGMSLRDIMKAKRG